MNDLPPIGEDEVTRARASFDAIISETAADLEGLRDLATRVKKLEADNAALRSRLGQLEHFQGRKAISSPAPVEREVTVTTPTPVSTFPMPTADELAKLLDAVGRYFPSLLSVDGPAFSGDGAERRKQYREQFAASFEAIGNMRRLERPSTKVYVSFHIQVAEKLLRSFGRPVTLRGNPFLAACLAHHDVPISGIGRMHEGIVVEIGLDEYSGKPATDQYRRILGGQPPREVAVQRPPASASPARVHYGF